MHLNELVAEIREGKTKEDDDPCLEVMLGHVLDHICYAWNARDLSAEEKYQMSQDAYQELTNLVPNFQCSRKLKDGSY